MQIETVLETERLRLTNWRPDQVDDLLALHGEAEITKYFSADGLPWDRAKCALRLNHWLEEFASVRMGKLRVLRKPDGEYVGRAGYSLHGPTGEPEIGYALFREFWGNGYATEAAAGLRDWIFRETDWDHFIGFADVRNQASLSVLKRIGMRVTDVRDFEGMPCQFHILENGVA